MEELALPQGTIRYRDSGGEGRPLLLLHGLLVNGRLWDQVLPRLGEGVRAIVPDLPLGSHTVAMDSGADLTPPGIAAIVDGLIEGLGLSDVVLAGNDTGGAIAQITAANHPQRIGALFLTNCDAYDNFLPPAFRYLQLLARVPGGVGTVYQTMRLRPLRQAPIAFGWLTSKPVGHDLSDAWVNPGLRDRAVRRDAAKVLRGISKRYTNDAIEVLRRADRPTLIAWGMDDRFFKPAFADRLAADIPGARLERIEGARTFTPIDAPERIAALLGELAAG